MSVAQSQFQAWLQGMGFQGNITLTTQELEHPVVRWLVTHICKENNYISPEDWLKAEEIKAFNLAAVTEEDLLAHAPSDTVPPELEKLQQQVQQLEEEVKAREEEVLHLERTRKIIQKEHDNMQQKPSPYNRLHTDAVRELEHQHRKADNVEGALKQMLTELLEAVKQLEELVTNKPSRWMLKSATADHQSFNDAATTFLTTIRKSGAPSPSLNNPSTPLKSTRLPPPTTPLPTPPLNTSAPTSEQLPTSANFIDTTDLAGPLLPLDQAKEELNRLRWLYPIARQQWLTSHIAAAEAEAGASAARELLREQAPTPASDDDPRTKQALMLEARRLEAECNKLERNVVPDLWLGIQKRLDAPMQLGQLRRALEALKASAVEAREKLDVTVGVAACHQLLVAAWKLQGEQLEQAYQTLQQVHRIASSFSAAAQYRASCYTASTSGALQGPRTTLHPADTYMHRLHKALDPTTLPTLTSIHQAISLLHPPTPSTPAPPSIPASKILSILDRPPADTPSKPRPPSTAQPAPSIVTLDSLVAAIKGIGTGIRDFNDATTTLTNQDIPSLVERLHTLTTRLHSTLHPDPSSPTPQLSDPQVQAAAQQLSDLCRDVQGDINRVVKASKAPRGHLWEGQPLSHHLLTSFFTEPHKLQDLVGAIRMRAISSFSTTSSSLSSRAQQGAAQQ